MRILQISTIWVPTSPNIYYGGTERVVYYLDREYVKRGHDSIVAASGDSHVDGKLLATVPKSFWAQSENGFRKITRKPELYKEHYRKILDFLLREGEFVDEKKIDIVHDHPGMSLIISEEYIQRKDKVDFPILVTLHGTFNEKEKSKYDKWKELEKDGRKIFFNTISNSQKSYFEKTIEIYKTIYHGLPLEDFPYNEKKENYLFSLGRISEEKGQHLAIDVAKETGLELVIAGEIHSPDLSYFNEKIRPHLNTQIKFIGPLNDEQKKEWYKKAKAFLMPIQWEEPFGLVIIEAMACGTPVIAFNRGSVPEIIKDGETGFIVNDTEEMINSVKKIKEISPYNCRKHVEENFTIQKEADEYLKLYEELIRIYN